MPGDLTRPGNLTAPAIPNSWTTPRVTELTFFCNTSVTIRTHSRQKCVCGGPPGDQVRLFSKGIRWHSKTSMAWPFQRPAMLPAGHRTDAVGLARPLGSVGTGDRRGPRLRIGLCGPLADAFDLW